MESERINCLDLCDTAIPIAKKIDRNQKHVSIILDKKGNIVAIGTNTRRRILRHRNMDIDFVNYTVNSIATFVSHSHDDQRN